MKFLDKLGGVSEVKYAIRQGIIRPCIDNRIEGEQDIFSRAITDGETLLRRQSPNRRIRMAESRAVVNHYQITFKLRATRNIVAHWDNKDQALIIYQDGNPPVLVKLIEQAARDLMPYGAKITLDTKVTPNTMEAL